MNTDNGNGTNGNGKSSHNGNDTNKNNTSGNGNAHSSIPSLVSIQQLEQLSTPASEIQPKPPNTAPRYIPKFDQPVGQGFENYRTTAKARLFQKILADKRYAVYVIIPTI